MDKIDISIIIPVYNTAEYLHDCYDSIAKQSFSNFEIIFINDGSTDDSLDILKEIEFLDHRIKIYNKNNEGQAIARNIGIEKANGEFIVFIDSDDYLKDCLALRSMYEIMVSNNYDFVQAGFEFIGKRAHTYRIKSSKFVTQGDILKSAIQVKSIYTSPWAKIYKRQFLISNKLFFPSGIVNEDTAHSIMISALATKVGFLNRTVYCSREREGSTSRTSYKRMFESMHSALLYTHDFLYLHHLLDESIDKVFKSRYLRSMLYNLMQTAQRSEKSTYLSDYNYCIENTNYIRYKKSSRFLPLKHRIMIYLSLKPNLFWFSIKLLNFFGLKMH